MIQILPLLYFPIWIKVSCIRKRKVHTICHWCDYDWNSCVQNRDLLRGFKVYVWSDDVGCEPSDIEIVQRKWKQKGHLKLRWRELSSSNSVLNLFEIDLRCAKEIVMSALKNLCFWNNLDNFAFYTFIQKEYNVPLIPFMILLLSFMGNFLSEFLPAVRAWTTLQTKQENAKADKRQETNYKVTNETLWHAAVFTKRAAKCFLLQSLLFKDNYTDQNTVAVLTRKSSATDSFVFRTKRNLSKTCLARPGIVLTCLLRK